MRFITVNEVPTCSCAVHWVLKKDYQLCSLRADCCCPIVAPLAVKFSRQKSAELSPPHRLSNPTLTLTLYLSTSGTGSRQPHRSERLNGRMYLPPCLAGMSSGSFQWRPAHGVQLRRRVPGFNQLKSINLASSSLASSGCWLS